MKQAVSGCGAVGSALDWGSRGRGFKSRHSDQRKVPEILEVKGFGHFLFIPTARAGLRPQNAVSPTSF